MKRLPPWLRIPLEGGGGYGAVERRLAEGRLATVCRGARCPNRFSCWKQGTATFMILGEECTRACTFCAVPHTPAPRPPDPGEPQRVADAARGLALEHVVITSVTRDDLPDGGAGHFAATVRAVRASLPAATIEVLTPDFKGDPDSVDRVLAAHPAVFNHNLETVRRLQGVIRPQASYDGSLSVLRRAARRPPAVVVKSGLMLGLGEGDDEVLAALEDLRAAGCEILTLGQYLAPSRAHHPVARFVPPGDFEAWADAARRIGFRAVAAAPLVRSSYRAGELLAEARSAAGSALDEPGRRRTDGKQPGADNGKAQADQEVPAPLGSERVTV